MELNVSCVMYLVTLVLSLCDRMEAYYWGTYDGVGKRGGMRPYPFPCNGYDNLPRCLHGGKGPRKTWTKAGRFCVCLCRPKWIGPECGYASDSAIGKRSNGLDVNDDRLSRMTQEAPSRRSWSLPWIRPDEVGSMDAVDDPRPFAWKYGIEQVHHKRSDQPVYVYDNRVNNGYDLLYDTN